MNYFLDTNIVLIYLRNNQQAHKIEQDIGLLSGEHNLIISIVSSGELHSIAMQNNWGEKKIKELETTLSSFLIADINKDDVIQRYAEIDAFSQGRLIHKKTSFSSRNMGKNDLWIAATASVLGIKLLSTDNDFMHLADEYIQLQIINLTEYQ